MQAAIKNSIQKTCIKPFYKEHAILLGLVYLIMFGAVRGDQLLEYHRKLIEGTVTSYAAMGIVFTIWFIYFVRSIYFLISLIRKREYSFLQQLSLLPKKVFKLTLIKIITICLLPISTYAIAIISWALVHEYYLQVFIIAAFICTLHFIGTVLLYKHLTNTEYKLWKPLYFSYRFNLPKKFALQFYIKYLFTQQSIQWLLLKLIGFISIKALFHGGTPDDELRFSTVLYILLFLAHTNLISQFVVWEITNFWHTRLLPISMLKKLCNYFVFIILLILPEIILFATAYPQHLTGYHTISILVLNISSLFFLFTVVVAFQNVSANYMPLLALFLLLTYGFVLADKVLLFSITSILICTIICRKSLALLELEPNEK